MKIYLRKFLSSSHENSGAAPFLLAIFAMGCPASWSFIDCWTAQTITHPNCPSLSLTSSCWVLYDFYSITRELSCIFYILLEFSFCFLVLRIICESFKNSKAQATAKTIQSQFLVFFGTPQVIPMCNFENQ